MEKIQKLFDIAAKELEGLSGYQRADIAIRLAQLVLDDARYDEECNASAVIPTKNDLDSKQVFENLNNKAKVQVTAKKAPAAEPKTASAPAPKAEKKEEAPASADEDWANKKLTSEEYDNTWTDRMKANNDLYRDNYMKLGQFIASGLKAKAFDFNWLNKCAAECTHGTVTDLRDFKNVVNPKNVKLLKGYIFKMYHDLHKNA